MKHRTRPALALVGCVALLAACSTEAPEASGGGGGGDEVRTGNGVTDDTINVGILTDLSGPFAVSAPLHVSQIRAYWDQVNADGGVCGRNVEVEVQDHQYDPQRAVGLYRSMAPDVAALQQVLGSPVVAALLPLAQEDDLYVGGMGWSSVVLDYPNAHIPGTTYSVESANGIDYLVDELGLSEGDRVGVVYFEGDLGGDSLAGAEYAAEQRGLEIVPQQITPADTDLSAQASALREAGVSAVILGAAPAQLASLAAVLASQGLDVPLLGNSPTYNPSLLDGPAGPALLDNFYFLSSIAPYSADEPGVQEAVELHQAAGGDTPPGWEIPAGSAEAMLLRTAIENACEAGDLTPAGIVAGIREITDLETGGILPAPLDYSEEGQPPMRSVYLLRADADVEGGLRMEDTLLGPSAESYTFD
ncbi:MULTISPECIES: ABC transporter substrate-binding protein [unclassified Modestobacter]